MKNPVRMDRDQDQQRLRYREGWSSTAHAKANVVTGRAGRDGTRKAVRGGDFTHRRGAEILAHTTITSAPQLLAILAEHFDLHFPAGTHFGAA